MPRLMATITGFILVCALAACADLPLWTGEYTNGLLTGTNGMTLYTFTGRLRLRQERMQRTVRDQLAAAYGKCRQQERWRLDRDQPRRGSRQWALNGKPLYFWSKDQNPGDVTGDGFKGVARRQARAAATDGQHEPVVEGRDLDSQHIPRLRRYARALTGDPVAPTIWCRIRSKRALVKFHLWRPGSDLARGCSRSCTTFISIRCAPARPPGQAARVDEGNSRIRRRKATVWKCWICRLRSCACPKISANCCCWSAGTNDL